MCYNCYEEAGMPKLINERTKKAAQLIDEIYKCKNGGVGGYAHIVVDDWNLENSNIDWCIEEAKKGQYESYDLEVQQTSLACLNYLKTLNEEEKYSAMALHSKFIKI